VTVIGDFRNKMLSGFRAVDVKGYKINKFKQNNKVIIILSVFIIIEQFLCSQFLCSQFLYKKIFFINSLVMFLFFTAAVYLNRKNQFNAIKLNYFFEIVVTLAAVTFISLRITLIQQDVFYLPSVYIAVIFGIAVFLILDYKQSFIIYFIGSVFLISLIIFFRPSVDYNTIFIDITVNNFIAWVVSIINYKKSINEFNHLKIIEDNYLSLNKRNERMNKINTKLRSKSITDELTKLYNRREIEKNLDYLFVKANSNIHYKFSVIMCDLDDFSKVNNSFGHQTGDKVLTKVSNIFKKNIRDSDICGRWGGEEFIILSPDTSIKEAYHLAERLREALEESDFDEVKTVTASFGVSSFSIDDNRDDLITRADKRLYKAKENGKNKTMMR
jgi:diguanylate cyclase (GGDEF)-like protein